MKINTFTKFLGALLIGSVVFTSCKKENEVDPLGERGQTIVKLVDGAFTDTPFLGAQPRPIDFVSTTQTLTVADIRRDVPNATELDRTMTVTLRNDTSFINLYNEYRELDGDDPVERLDPSLFSLVTTNGVSLVGGEGGTYTVVMQPGEFAKEIQVVIPDATVLDVSTTYALAFTILTTDPSATISDSKTFIALISAKNKYDGVYNVTGTMVDLVNAAFTGNYPRTYYLVTAGASSVDVMQVINGALVPGYLFLNGTAGTFFGNFGLTVTFDPATDKIIDLHNYYGDPSKTATAVGNPALGSGAPLYMATGPTFRRAVLDPSGANEYVEATKTVNVKYILNQANVVPQNRSFISETWRYIGPR